MDEPFNPYVEWLGLTASTVKPDHYRLLGLPPFESDARRITSACDGMLAKVRSNRPGAHVRDWQALLDELNAARNCLLDDSARAVYDEKLRNGDELPTPAAPKPAPSAPSSSGAGYMWPPGYEPPAAKPVAAPTSISSAVVSQPNPTNLSAPTAQVASHFDPPTTNPSQQPAVPVVSPLGNQTSEPAAMPVANPTVANPSYVPGPMAMPSYGNASSEPAAAPASWAQPTQQPSPGSYSSGSYNNGGYGAPTQLPVAGSALPYTSPAPYAPVANPVPPASPYGMHGVDPMAPVAGPIGGSASMPTAMPTVMPTAMPTAMPIGGYGQPATAAPAAPSYAQPIGTPYSASPAPAMTVTAAPISGLPVAAAPGMNAGQAVPVRAMPVTATAAEPEIGLKVPTKSATKAYKQSRKKNSVSTAIAALLAASLLVVAAFFVALKDGNLLAKKDEVPRSASEMQIPKDVPPPVDPRADRSPAEILAPLGDDHDSAANPTVKKPRSSKIGPLVEEGQTPESVPLVDPQMKVDRSPANVIPKIADPNGTMKPEEMPPVSTATAEQAAAVRKALGESIIAMGYRDWDTAAEKLAEAKALAPDEALQEKVDAVEQVSEGVEEFWNAVRESTKSLGAGQELVIGSTRVAVVEANDKLLILRVAGANKRYPLDDLPMGLARTLASSWFDNSAASTKVFTGAFLFVEPNGDPEEVRQLWQAAKQGGVNVEPLIGLLEDDLKAAAKSDNDKS